MRNKPSIATTRTLPESLIYWIIEVLQSGMENPQYTGLSRCCSDVGIILLFDLDYIDAEPVRMQQLSCFKHNVVIEQV